MTIKMIMKYGLSLLIVLFLSSFFVGGGKSNVSFKVFGNCDMCKVRIEKSLKTTGVFKSTWDVKTLMISVTYDAKKISIDQIHEKISKAGYETDKLKADADAYSKLPKCCQYKAK